MFFLGFYLISGFLCGWCCYLLIKKDIENKKVIRNKDCIIATVISVIPLLNTFMAGICLKDLSKDWMNKPIGKE